MKRVAVLFSGTGSNFKYILDNLHKRDIEVVVAITNNPKAKGIEYAKEYNIPLYIVDSKRFSSREEFDREIVKILKRYRIDFAVLAGFMRILTPVFTDNIRAINLHPSLLPRHKGLKAIERSFEDEFKEGGVTVHFVNEELDGGEIILQEAINKEGLSFNDYYQKIRTIEKKALAKAIIKISK
jgi:phosphoribosylglycinamide formyltransferase-1